MAFAQYTRCIDPAQFRPRSLTTMVSIAAGVAFALAFAAVAAGHPACALIAAEAGIPTFWILYTRNFLYERLICLEGDKDVLGAAISVSLPGFDFWDNDYSLNLLLCGTEFGASYEEAQASPSGRLVAPHDTITNPPVSRATVGYNARDQFGTGRDSVGLHAEFEGSGPYTLMKFAEAALGFTLAAYLACLFLIPGLDLLLALIILILLVLGGASSNYTHPGTPTDVNPEIPTIEVNRGGRNEGADILYVQGAWVHDSLHGWNEIHPIKVCTRMGRWAGSWAGHVCVRTDDPTPPDIILRLRREFDLARAEETLANQARPEHQWSLHPDLDGCASNVIL